MLPRSNSNSIESKISDALIDRKVSSEYFTALMKKGNIVD